MFACLYSLSTPIAALVALAESFTPRFEVVGPLVMLDVSGLSRLFGSPQEIGEQLRRSAGVPLRIAVAPTQTAAALLAMGRAGMTVVLPGDTAAALAPLPVSVLADFDRLRVQGAGASAPPGPATPAPATPPVPVPVPLGDALPYFEHSLRERATPATVEAYGATVRSGGWTHPRDAHVASAFARRETLASFGGTPSAFARLHPSARYGETSSAFARSASFGGTSSASARLHSSARYGETSPAASAPGGATADKPAVKARLKGIDAVADTLRRWGVKTLAALTALPAGDVYERLGARGVQWQRLAGGDDRQPLVPWVPEDPFEGSLDLEWPIEGLEPLSFVLGRLFDPLAERLERADRGAAIVHTHLRLVNKDTHARQLQLPAPMRDPKTLRTLVLLDLETHPPAAAIDRVRVLVEPTPARVVQWALFERAQASPEQVSTLLARLTALMGEGHVGSPQLVDSWKPGVFALAPFTLDGKHEARAGDEGRTSTQSDGPALALRRFRLPVPARVQMRDGRPVRVMTDRRGVTGGMVVQAAGPWRTSGEWWNDGDAGRAWDRDEWDVALADGTLYRVSVERDGGHWFIDGVLD